MTHHELSADLVIVGGGLAGVCAALAAARHGSRVVLLQDRSVLGGNSSSEVRMHIVGADCHGTRPGARETGLIEELRLEDAARNPHRAYPLWDLLLYEKVNAEPNITLLLDTDCTGCDLHEVNGDRPRLIAAVRALRNTTEDSYTIRAPFFVDASGDGRLGAEAGADFVQGRESRADYGESLALAQGDACTLGASILFTARRHATPQPFLAPSWARTFTRDDFRHRPIKSYEYGYWWSEWGGQLDMVKDSPLIRHELLRIALGVWNYIKNSGDHPDSAPWALEWVGAIPGKRESRRFLGPHVLTQHDIEAGRIFEDQVAYGGWWMDLHPPTGIDAVNEPPCEQVNFPHLYSIPLRALYSRNVGNLFFAGRNISATHVAFASTRVMATCSVVGQAVGTAASLARDRAGESIAAIFDAARLARLQQRLLRDDAFLPSLRNTDALDLARAATVHASSESDSAPRSAAKVTDGLTRELFTHLGPWADGDAHCWVSAGLPAWIELSWPEPQLLSEIHLTFDSGLQRELILSASDSVTAKVVRGAQPELVRDYTLTLDDEPVATVSGNLQRKRIHRLTTPRLARYLRLTVTAAHGVPDARVFEIRAY